MRHWHHKPLKAKFYALVSRKQSFPIWTQHTRVGVMADQVAKDKQLRITILQIRRVIYYSWTHLFDPNNLRRLTAGVELT